MHQVSTKTPMGPPGSPGSSGPSESAKLPGPPEKLPRTPTGQILNKMNDPNSKYFESPQIPTPTPANTTCTARIFSKNSIQILATNEFDQSISQLKSRPIFRQISQSKFQNKQPENEKQISYRYGLVK